MPPFNLLCNVKTKFDAHLRRKFSFSTCRALNDESETKRIVAFKKVFDI